MSFTNLSNWEASFDEDYQAYLDNKGLIENKRYRSENETIFEAFSSKEADFTTDEEGKNIVKLIQDLK